MSEIYLERLEAHQYEYMSRDLALREAIDEITADTLLTPDQIQDKLSELSEIAKREGLNNTYLGALWDKVAKERSYGEDF